MPCSLALEPAAPSFAVTSAHSVDRRVSPTLANSPEPCDDLANALVVGI
jgi:hypothetical protein